MSTKRMFYLSLILDACFEGGRLFVGATSAAYLLTQGLGLSEIAIIKGVQALIIVLGEIPTGVLADSWGHKRSMLFSLAVAVLGFILYYVGHSLPVFICAEILVALALCFWSGAYEAFAIETAKLESEPGLMDRFFHLNQAINSGAVLVCGYLGGQIGMRGMGLPYLGAALVLFFAFICLVPVPSERQAKPLKECGLLQRGAFVEKAKAAFENGFMNPRLLPFFLANIGIQFAIQPLLQYWQPFFQSFGEGVTTEALGQIFGLYCGVNLIFGMLAARLSKVPFFRSKVAVTAIFSLFGLSYFLTGVSQTAIVATIFFCLAQGLLSVARTALSVRFNEAISGLPRASILSSLSLVSRLGMVTALGVLALGSKVGVAHTERVLFSSFGAISLALSLSVGVYMAVKSQKKIAIEEAAPLKRLAQ